MKIHQLHPWDIPYKEAITIQRRLSKKIREIPLAKPLKTIAGADVSYSRKSHDFYAAVLVFTFPDLILVDEAMACQKVKFPYIAGLLTFREGPVLIKAFRKIRKKPDVHMGLILDCPTIGCAKTRLVGIHAPVAENRGSTALLTDQGRVIGSVLRTRDHVKPVFVSSGHAITLAEALDLVMACCRGYRLPEPIRQAHLAVNRLRIEKEGSLS